MNLKNKMFSALLAGSMGLAMVTPVMAAESTVTPSTTIPTIEKTVTANKGLTFDETFTFDVAAKDETEEIADKTITVNLTEGTAGATASTALVSEKDLDNLKKLVPGVYEYTVTENKGTTTGMTYDSKSYTLRVYVKYVKDSDGNYTKDKEISYTLANTGDNTKIDAGTDGLKLAFNNVFKPTVNFTVDKVVKGDYADKTQKFDIDVTYTNANGETITENIQNSHDDAAQEFTALAGTTITVVEKDSLGYTTTYTYDGGNGLKSVKDTLLTWKKAEAGKIHEVKVINTKQNPPVTGIIMNNLPFILLVVLGTAGIGFYLASKRRMN